MPKFQRYNSTREVAGSISFGARANGAGLGEALQGVGQGIQRNAQNASRVAAAANLADLRLAFTTDLGQLKETAPEDPTGFAKSAEDAFDARINDASEQRGLLATDREAFRASAGALKAQFMADAISAESRMMAEHRVRRVTGGIENLATSVYQDPLQYAAGVTAAATLIESTGLSGAAEAELLRGTKAQMADSLVRGYVDVQQDPAAAREALATVKDDLPQADFARLTRVITAAEKSQESARTANRTAANALMSDVAEIMTDGDPLDPDLADQVEQAVRLADDPRTTQKWARMKSLRTEIEKARGMPPDVLADYIDTNLAPAVADGATPLEKDKLTGATAVLKARVTAAKAAKADVNARMDDILDNIDARAKGGTLPADELDKALTFAQENASSLSSENAERLAGVLADAAASNAGTATPVQMQATVQALRQRAGESEAAQLVHDAFVGVQKAQRTALDRDPLTYADGAGVIQLNDITDLSFKSLTERHRGATRVAKHYGTPYRFFTPTEVQTISSRMREAAPSEVVAFAKNVADALPSKGGEVMAAFDGAAPILATVGGLVSADPRLLPTAEVIVRGARLIEEGGYKVDGTVSADMDEAVAPMAAEWTGMDPRDVAALRKAALAYIAGSGGDADPDEAINIAVGGMGDEGGGGVASTEFGDHTILPVGVTEDRLENAVERIRAEDLARISTNGMPPVFDAATAGPELFDEAEFASIGPGVYQVYLDGAPVHDASGDIYTIRFDAKMVDELITAGPRE